MINNLSLNSDFELSIKKDAGDTIKGCLSLNLSNVVLSLNKEAELANHLTNLRETEKFWAGVAVERFGVFNNLLISLGTGFLAFAFKELAVNQLTITFTRILWRETFLFFSMLFIGLSIIVGLYLAYSRLINSHTLRQVHLVRLKIFKEKKESIVENPAQTHPLIKSIFLPFIRLKKIDISETECSEYSKDKTETIKKFNKLKNVTKSLTILTQKAIIIQTILFFLAIISYCISFFF